MTRRPDVTGRAGLSVQAIRRVLTGAEAFEEFDDELLSGRCGVEFAAHLDKSVVNLLETFIYRAETFVHLFAQGVEATDRGFPEVVQLASEILQLTPALRDIASEIVQLTPAFFPEVVQLVPDFCDVAVGASGKHTRGCGVLSARMYLLG
jgi:hypothetical protein